MKKNYKQPINIFHINVRSIRNKLDLFNVFLSDNPCQVLTINEHWLKKEECSLYIPQGFVIGDIYCRENYLGGGCAIFIKKGIDFKVLNVKKFCTEKCFEVTAVILPSSNFIIVSLYRSPDTNLDSFLKTLESLLIFLNKKHKSSKLAITSDFNVNILKKSPETNALLNFLSSFNLYLSNKEATRESACLDNIVSNVSRENIVCTVIEPHLSDHAGILANFYGFSSCEVYKEKRKTVRNISPSAILNFKDQ